MAELIENTRIVRAQQVEKPLEVIEVPDRRLRRAAAQLAARTAQQSDTEVTVMLPRRAFHVTSRLLHDHTADKIAGAVSRLPHVAAMIVPFDVVEAIEEMQDAEVAGAGKTDVGATGAPGLPQRPVRRTRKMLLDAECRIEGDQRSGHAGIEDRSPIAARDGLVSRRGCGLGVALGF